MKLSLRPSLRTKPKFSSQEGNFSSGYELSNPLLPDYHSEIKFLTPVKRPSFLIRMKEKYAYSRFYKAVCKGDIDKVKKLLKGIDLNQPLDKEGCTALMIAAKNKQYNIVELLLAYGADVNLKNKIGDTALIFASGENGSLEILKALLKAGAKVNLVGNEGITALRLAAAWGNTQIVECLLTANPELEVKGRGATALMMAARNGHRNIVQLLKAAGASLYSISDKGFTALMYAVESEQLAIVRDLIEVNDQFEKFPRYLQDAIDLANLRISNRSPGYNIKTILQVCQEKLAQCIKQI